MDSLSHTFTSCPPAFHTDPTTESERSVFWCSTVIANKILSASSVQRSRTGGESDTTCSGRDDNDNQANSVEKSMKENDRHKMALSTQPSPVSGLMREET